MYSPEITQKIAEWRRKVLENTISREEMQQAIILLRQGRVSAAEAQKKSRSSGPKKPTKSADELLSEL
jgi:capsule polysaccharide export protein KpsE/RkpR